MVDVAGHRVGTAFAGIFLLGMALRRPAELRPSRLVAWVFRIVGIAAFGCGNRLGFCHAI